MKRNLSIILAALALSAGIAHADIVYLLNGGTLEGKVTKKDGKVYIERHDGLVVISADQVDYIEAKKTDFELYLERFKELKLDAEGAGQKYADLGQWAAERNFKTQAEVCYRKAIEADPNQDAARAALGYVKYDGRWMPFDEAQKARGFVKHKDAWVTPEAKSDLEKLEAATALEKAKAESERLRLARAEAELQAAHAKADAAQAQVDALREEIRYRDGYGGYPIYGFPRRSGKPAFDKDIVLGPGDKATVTNANPVNGALYTKPDGTTARVLTIYRPDGTVVTRPIYTEPPKIIDPSKP